MHHEIPYRGHALHDVKKDLQIEVPPFTLIGSSILPELMVYPYEAYAESNIRVVIVLSGVPTVWQSQNKFEAVL